jgi:hypothetical protein
MQDLRTLSIHILNFLNILVSSTRCLMLHFKHNIVTCYLLTRRIIMWVLDFMLDSLHVTSGGVTIAYNTSKYITWANNFSWYDLLLRNCCDEHLFPTASADFVFQTPSDISSLWLGPGFFRGDPSPTATSAPFLDQLVSSGSLIS